MPSAVASWWVALTETIIHKLRVVGMSRMFMARLEICLGTVEIEVQRFPYRGPLVTTPRTRCRVILYLAFWLPESL